MPIKKTLKACNAQLDNLRLFAAAAATAKTAARLYGCGFGVMLKRVLWAIRAGRFEPAEALVNGILDPAMPREHARLFVSKRELSNLQERVNPRHWYYTTEDKGIFYRACEAAGIQVPLVQAIVFRNKHGWARDGSPMGNLKEIGAFLERAAPERMIIKPSRGAHGRSVWAVDRLADGSFSGAAGKQWRNGEEVAGAVLADTFFDAFVVQERLTNHPGLRALTGSEALQSSRVVTYVDRGETVHFIAASIRLICGQAVIDNIDWGRTGNFALQLDPQTGRPMHAMTFVHDGKVMQWVAPEEHPKLGERVRHFEVPEWDRVVELLQRAARKFLPLRTLGWDVAITPDGPMIVEANFRWDPMMHPSMRSAVDTIKRDVEAA